MWCKRTACVTVPYNVRLLLQRRMVKLLIWNYLKVYWVIWVHYISKVMTVAFDRTTWPVPSRPLFDALKPPRCLIPAYLLSIFTRQLEILVTTLLSDGHAESSCTQDTIDIFISYKHVQMKKWKQKGKAYEWM